MAENMGTGLSGISGASSSSVPQTREEIFGRNIVAFRRYALSQGAYYDANGWLIYRGRVLTRADSEYLDQSEETSQRLLDEEEIREAWVNLVSYAEEEGE